MKKLIVMALLLSIIASFGGIAFAESSITSPDVINEMKNMSDTEVYLIFSNSLIELITRGVFVSDNVNEALDLLKGVKSGSTASAQTKYTFGQGTYITGLDLQAGTYDLTCKTASTEDIGSSMSDFSDFYSSQGMDDYANMFGSLGGMYDNISGLTVTIYDANGSLNNYLTLKVNETARIILEDGMKLELTGGTSELTFIR